MPSVEKCPATLAEVNASSKLLNCGFDPYGNNRYMCLPNTEKSSLVEFCFDGLMGIQEKGNCLEEKDGRVILHSCSTFLSGCPKKPFNNYDFYKCLKKEVGRIRKEENITDKNTKQGGSEQRSPLVKDTEAIEDDIGVKLDESATR
uniref:Uncharacterized protein LOC111100634 isoform X3 n=1 Tax=Crassostrea virginica TaxID=6565 RepID=A0A8B8AAD3_CRAVI|nr:uncharacterized protein LOC111100634 isoform X3 [Crassostrea virginica]